MHMLVRAFLEVQVKSLKDKGGGSLEDDTQGSERPEAVSGEVGEGLRL